RMGGVLKLLKDPATAEAGARRVLETIAVATQASLMRRYSDAAAADAFIESRLEDSVRAFGALPIDAAGLKALVERGRIAA
ncbi:MAG TPA: hypothetical protein VFU92_06805, partial [Usitatibacter sp.]|nr:hypothetical protein [Usitatibacter sp.]